MHRAPANSSSFVIVIITLLAHLHLALAVSLADFTPYATGLDSTCEALYTAQIVGCSPSDFTASGICSQTCINALNALQGPAIAECPGVTGQNLMVVAINGQASIQLCRNGVIASSSAIVVVVSATSAPVASITSPDSIAASPTLSSTSSYISASATTTSIITSIASTRGADGFSSTSSSSSINSQETAGGSGTPFYTPATSSNAAGRLLHGAYYATLLSAAMPLSLLLTAALLRHC